MPEVLLRHDAASNGGQGGDHTSRRRGRRLGIEVKPGAVRQARLEAGLSLGQVARDDVSRTAIYFVETGKARPSMETLRLIAERTGKPVDFFLSESAASPAGARVAVAELERLLATGDNSAAVSAGERLLQRKLDAESEATVNQLVAQALTRLARPVDARRYAAAARAYFERAGDLLMVAECLATEANAAFLLQEASVLTLAEAALNTLRSLKAYPASTESRLLLVLGGAYLQQRNWEKAIAAYEQAIEAAGSVKDLRRLSIIYTNIGVAYQELGQFSRASQFSRQALSLYDTLQDRIGLARGENNLGVLLARLGEYASAGEHLDRSLALFDEVGVELGKSAAMLSFCELLADQQRYDEAEAWAKRALELAKRTKEAPAQADAHHWLALVASRRGRDQAADGEFEAALATLEGVEAAELRRRIHVDYADVLEKRGDLVAANRQLKLALRGATERAATAAGGAIA